MKKININWPLDKYDWGTLAALGLLCAMPLTPLVVEPLRANIHAQNANRTRLYDIFLQQSMAHAINQTPTAKLAKEMGVAVFVPVVNKDKKLAHIQFIPTPNNYAEKASDKSSYQRDAFNYYCRLTNTKTDGKIDTLDEYLAYQAKLNMETVMGFSKSNVLV